MSLYDAVNLAQKEAAKPLDKNDAAGACAKIARAFFAWFIEETRWHGKITFAQRANSVFSESIDRALKPLSGSQMSMNVKLAWEGAAVVLPFRIFRTDDVYSVWFLDDRFEIQSAAQLGYSSAAKMIHYLIGRIETGLVGVERSASPLGSDPRMPDQAMSADITPTVPGILAAEKGTPAIAETRSSES